MRLLKKLNVFLLAGLMALSSTSVLAETPAASATQSVATEKEDSEKAALKNDFYAAVNKEWLSTAKIKEGHVSKDNFSDIDDLCKEQIQKLFDDLLAKQSQYKEGSIEKNIINLYNNYMNTKVRDEQKLQPAQKYLDEIKAISDLKDVTNFLAQSEMGQDIGLLQFDIYSDLKDTSKNVVYLGSTALLLGDADYYNKTSDYGTTLEKATTTYLKRILVLSGYTEAEAAAKVANAYKFEKMLTSSMIGQDEANQYDNVEEKLYNVYTIDQLDKVMPNVDIKTILKGIGLEKVNKVILQEPKWAEALNKAYTKENLPIIKDYMEVRAVTYAANYASSDYQKASEEFAAALTGVQGTRPLKERALNFTQNVFGDAVGKLYVQKYFSEKAKKDVEEMVHEIIAKYKEKLAAVDWMNDATKKNAIKKLDTMVVKIGYPDKWEEYKGLTVKSYADNSSLFENVLEVQKWAWNKSVASLDKPVDRSSFLMTPQTVNACYDPLNNDITFPAAILQAPFYDVNRSREANLGAIGAVIGHEISHAFDTSGANYDENGNMKNWWTDQDYSKFSEKTKAVRKFYSTVKINNQNVNGDLTVTENVADITSVSCMLDILKDMENPDYDTFFRSWAVTWRSVMTPEYVTYLLANDTHSPDKVRANTVLSQFQEFYDTYDIKEGDGMYVKPEDRLKIY